MHLFFWKKNKKKEPIIIKKECYDKLPKHHQQEFEIISNDPEEQASATHHVMYDDAGNYSLYNTFGIGAIALGAAIVAEEIASQDQQQSFPDPVNDAPQQDFQGFGGGDGGGGGAGSDYSQPDNSSSQDFSSQDNSSSYDSGSSDSSSFDSGSSSDSGGGY